MVWDKELKNKTKQYIFFDNFNMAKPEITNESTKKKDLR